MNPPDLTDEITKDAMKNAAVKEIEALFDENRQIRGHVASMGDGRVVFIGEHPKLPDAWCIAFRNLEGDITRLKLSKDAMAVLVQLYNRPRKGDDIFPLHIKTQWQVVVQAEAEEP